MSFVKVSRQYLVKVRVARLVRYLHPHPVHHLCRPWIILISLFAQKPNAISHLHWLYRFCRWTIELQTISFIPIPPHALKMDQDQRALSNTNTSTCLPLAHDGGVGATCAKRKKGPRLTKAVLESPFTFKPRDCSSVNKEPDYVDVSTS